MAESHRWEWAPLVSIGGIRFNEPLPEDLGGLKLELFDEPEMNYDDNEDVFREVGGNTQFYLENGLVELVYCYDNFYFKGRNLMGLSAEEVMEIIGGNWVRDEEEDDDRVFDEEDLEITISEEDGAVWSIVVHGPYDEE